MLVSYHLLLPGSLMLPSAAYLLVEIRDTSLMDAPSITLAATQYHSGQLAGRTVIHGEIELPGQIAPKATITLWAHLSLSGEARVNKEDFLTTRAFPVTKTNEQGVVLVELQPVSR